MKQFYFIKCSYEIKLACVVAMKKKKQEEKKKKSHLFQSIKTVTVHSTGRQSGGKMEAYNSKTQLIWIWLVNATLYSII